MLVRRRLSRIFYRRRFFDYPLTLNASTVRNLGLIEAFKNRIELRPGATQVPIARDNLGRFSHQPLRNSPVPYLLQGLHREGLGRAVHGDFRGMGRAAHQRPVGRESHCARADEPVSQLVRRRSEGNGNQSDRAIPVSQIRTRPDVGGGCPARDCTWGSGPLAAARGRLGAMRPTRSSASTCSMRLRGAVRRIPCDYFLSTMPVKELGRDVEA